MIADSATKQERFQRLVQGHLDGSLDQSEHRELGELLKSSPRHARAFAFMARLEVAQHQLARGGLVPLPTRAAPVPRAWLTAAAAIMALAVAWAVIREDPSPNTRSRQQTGGSGIALLPEAATTARAPRPPRPEPMPPVTPRQPRVPDKPRRQLANTGSAPRIADTLPSSGGSPVRAPAGERRPDVATTALAPRPPRPEPMPPVTPRRPRVPDKPRRQLANAGSAPRIADTLPSSGGSPAARVAFLSGRIMVQGLDGKRRRPGKGDAVVIGETVLSGRGSKVELRFADGTTLALGPRARVRLDEFFYAAGDRRSRCTASIARGAFKVVSGLIARIAPDRIKLKTPTATIGIRGTTCVGTTDERTTIAVYTQGKAISVTNDLGQTILTGKPGMGCETLAGKAPGRPRMYKLAQIQRITRLVTMQAARRAARSAANAAVGAVHVPVVRH